MEFREKKLKYLRIYKPADLHHKADIIIHWLTQSHDIHNHKDLETYKRSTPM